MTEIVTGIAIEIGVEDVVAETATVLPHDPDRALEDLEVWIKHN